MNDEWINQTTWGAKLGGQIYWNAINALRDVWFEIYNERIEVSVTGRAGFKRLLDEIKQKLVEKRGLQDVVARLKVQGFDLAETTTPDQLFRSLLTSSPGVLRDIDDITPNEFKGALYDVAEARRTSGNDEEDIPLDTLFRQVLDLVWKTKSLTGRINVGENRHFPRMYQWLLEVAEETDWGTGRGLRVLNASKSGPVKSNPTGPRGLIVRLNYHFI